MITSETKLRDEDYGMILDTLCLDGKVWNLISIIEADFSSGAAQVVHLAPHAVHKCCTPYRICMYRLPSRSIVRGAASKESNFDKGRR